jgi:hypothetical protein
MSEVRYEEIVSEPESIIRRLLDECGLEWDETCLRFEENASPVYTASLREVRQPLYHHSVCRWKAFSTHLAPLAEQLAQYVQVYSAHLRGPSDTHTLQKGRPQK